MSSYEYFLVPKYINEIPKTNIPLHHTYYPPSNYSNHPHHATGAESWGIGPFVYFWRLGSVGSVTVDEFLPNVRKGVTGIGVMCGHKDSRGRIWSTW